MKWRPQRTVEIRRAVNFERGVPEIDGFVLSPLEFELLLRCSSKLRFEDVLEELYAVFGDRFDGVEAFNDCIARIVRSFDARYWLVFCKV